MNIEEKRQLRKNILSETKPTDWTRYVDRMSLKPKGAVKIATKFNISIKNLLQKKDKLDDGHYTYYFQATFQQSDNPISVDAFGLACSRKAKYCKRDGFDIELKEINENMVAYDAYLNMVKVGVVTLLCLNNVSPAEFEDDFINEVISYKFNKKRY